MPTRYIFLDDQTTDALNPYIQTVQRANPELKIEHRRPRGFEKTIELIRAGAGKSGQSKVNGYILDLRLDEEKVDGEDRASYPGQTVAQQLRSMMARSLINPVPIVVWSVENRIESYYTPDDTAKDLFDRVYGKDVDVSVSPDRVADEMISLSTGYQRIQKTRENQKGSFERMLGLSEKAASALDPRIGEDYRGARKASVHEVARYIHRVLISSRGPLIDEHVLAARLGVDFQNSEDWEALRSEFRKTAAYKGVFGEAWPRWWGARIESWWSKVCGKEYPLKRLTSVARVERLSERLMLNNLRPAQPVANENSSIFWTICEVTKKPLDPVDGFRTRHPESEEMSWNEPLYLSLASVISGEARRQGYKLHPLERERFNELKKILRK